MKIIIFLFLISSFSFATHYPDNSNASIHDLNSLLDTLTCTGNATENIYVFNLREGSVAVSTIEGAELLSFSGLTPRERFPSNSVTINVIESGEEILNIELVPDESRFYMGTINIYEYEMQEEVSCINTQELIPVVGQPRANQVYHLK